MWRKNVVFPLVFLIILLPSESESCLFSGKEEKAGIIPPGINNNNYENVTLFPLTGEKREGSWWKFWEKGESPGPGKNEEEKKWVKVQMRGVEECSLITVFSDSLPKRRKLALAGGSFGEEMRKRSQAEWKSAEVDLILPSLLSPFHLMLWALQIILLSWTSSTSSLHTTGWVEAEERRKWRKRRNFPM